MQNGHISQGPAGGMKDTLIEHLAGSKEAEAPTVDLAAYARGEADYDLADVLAEIDRWAVAEVERLAAATARIATHQDAIAFLEAEGLVDADEVADIDDLDD